MYPTAIAGHQPVSREAAAALGLRYTHTIPGSAANAAAAAAAAAAASRSSPGFVPNGPSATGHPGLPAGWPGRLTSTPPYGSASSAAAAAQVAAVQAAAAQAAAVQAAGSPATAFANYAAAAAAAAG